MAWPAITQPPTLTVDGGKVKYPIARTRYDSGVGPTFATDGENNDFAIGHVAVINDYDAGGWGWSPAEITGGGGSTPPPTEGQLWPRGDHTQPD